MALMQTMWGVAPYYTPDTPAARFYGAKPDIGIGLPGIGLPGVGIGLPTVVSGTVPSVVPGYPPGSFPGLGMMGMGNIMPAGCASPSPSGAVSPAVAGGGGLLLGAVAGALGMHLWMKRGKKSKK